MPSLARLWASSRDEGRPLDIPFRRMAELVKLKTGELAILAGEEGGGKSTVALNWAYRTSDPVLYLAQENPGSVKRRLTAMALSMLTGDVDPDDREYYLERLRGKRDTLVVERGQHTLAKLEAWLVAMREWVMNDPFIVFIDNIKDLDVDGHLPSSNDFYESVLPPLKHLCIEYDCAIVGLHHANRDSAAGAVGTAPLGLGRLLYGGGRDARHVWGVYRGYGDRTLNLQVLKQQDGRSDPGGQLQVRFDWQPENGVLYSR